MRRVTKWYPREMRNELWCCCLQDRGSPPRNSSTTIQVSVLDNDDMSPKFSQDVYRTQVTEFYPLSVSRNAMPQEMFVCVCVDTAWNVWYMQRNYYCMNSDFYVSLLNPLIFFRSVIESCLFEIMTNNFRYSVFIIKICKIIYL